MVSIKFTVQENLDKNIPNKGFNGGHSVTKKNCH